MASAAAPSIAGRLPDFFIVGHAKSGTTALYEMLRAHPQIFMPDSKEPWFFAAELLERTPPRPEGTPRTLDEYRAWFAGARPEQRVGEASALYLWSHTAAGAIAEVQPEARIIAILREPASFLRSLHLQFLETYIETEPDFARALALEDARRQGRQVPRHTYWPQALLYSEHVRYVEQLRRYHEAFGARAGAGADLRRLPRRQRGHGAPGAALPRRRRHAPDPAEPREPDRARCAPGACTSSSTRSRSGTAAARWRSRARSRR